MVVNVTFHLFIKLIITFRSHMIVLPITAVNHFDSIAHYSCNSHW